MLYKKARRREIAALRREDVCSIAKWHREHIDTALTVG